MNALQRNAYGRRKLMKINWITIALQQTIKPIAIFSTVLVCSYMQRVSYCAISIDVVYEFNGMHSSERCVTE